METRRGHQTLFHALVFTMVNVFICYRMYRMVINNHIESFGRIIISYIPTSSMEIYSSKLLDISWIDLSVMLQVEIEILETTLDL